MNNGKNENCPIEYINKLNIITSYKIDKTLNWKPCLKCEANTWCATYTRYVEYEESVKSYIRRKKYLEKKKQIHLKKHPV